MLLVILLETQSLMYLTCGTIANPISGCTPFNIFGGPDLGLAAGRISAC